MTDFLKKDCDFSRLYETYRRLVFHIAFSILVNKEDADDIVQEVFIALYNSFPNFKSEKKMKSWIAIVTKNMSLNYRLRQKRETDYLLNRHSNTRGFSEDDKVMLDLNLILDQQEKTIIFLRVFDNLSFSLISLLTEKSKSSVIRIYRQSLKKLKRCYLL